MKKQPPLSSNCRLNSVITAPYPCTAGMRVRFILVSIFTGQSPARVGKMPVQLWQSERHTQYLSLTRYVLFRMTNKGSGNSWVWLALTIKNRDGHYDRPYDI